MYFNKKKFSEHCANTAAYINRQEANVSIFTRSRLLNDETLQICLERILQMDDETKSAPIRLRKLYKSWVDSGAPIIAISLAPHRSTIISTNDALLEQDLKGLIKGLSMRQGHIRVLTSGSDELIDKVQSILRNSKVATLPLN